MDSLVYVALSTIDFEKISLDVFNEICMFCFVKAEKLELVNTIPRTELFWKLSNIQTTNNSNGCPQKICHICLQTFKSIAKFVDQIKGNVIRFEELYQKKMNQLKTVSVLTPKLESEEEFEHDEAEIVKIEEFDKECADNNNDKIQHKENNNEDKEKNATTTTTIKLFKCPICDREFATYFKLQYHRLSHKTPEEFLCHECGKKFKNKLYIKRHILNVHMKVERHKCDICGKGFFVINAYREHLNSHTGETPYQCNYCGKRFTRYTNLVTHIQYHKLKNGEIEQNETTKPYLKLQCEICKHIFTNVHSLKVHIAKKHKNSSTTIISEEKFSCKECQEEYPTKIELRAHVREQHLNDEVCTDCGKFFKKKSSFLKHITICKKGNCTFSCNVCMKTFRRKDYLKSHEKIHTGIKLFNCKTCGMGYNNSKSYKKHLQTHEKNVNI